MTGELTGLLLNRMLDMEPGERQRIVAAMPPIELLNWDAAFEWWIHDGQAPPKQEHWRTWLMMAGRGFGKTRAGAEWIHKLARGRNKRIALVGATIDEARAVMVEGVSGILAVARQYRSKVKWEPSLGRLTWPSGSVAELFSGDSPDRLRGFEHDYAWCDEMAKWRRAEESWNNLQLGLRRGARPRALVTTTPRPMQLLERIGAQRLTVKTGGKTAENLNLPRNFVEAVIEQYGGTRLFRQEVEGELMSEAEGSMFPRDLIERCRRAAPLQFDRVVVAVDPPAGTDGDACGIIVAGRKDGACYVLADASIEGAGPGRWARTVAATARLWGTSHVVAEANNGGAMVGNVLTQADAGLRVKLVHASKGKSARAEPVAMRFEAGRAFLAGDFPRLEDEMAGMLAAGGYEGPSRSPDRADAMVWAMTELGETKSGVPRVRML